ncbi:hypothetical protein Asp14428_11210 [Actinoplanes sp. NBRC 14428]|nr:hypothetical protein Asp14428_11210 [Actinoplanes sp. NBRC 14428]
MTGCAAVTAAATARTVPSSRGRIAVARSAGSRRHGAGDTGGVVIGRFWHGVLKRARNLAVRAMVMGHARTGDDAKEELAGP